MAQFSVSWMNTRLPIEVGACGNQLQRANDVGLGMKIRASCMSLYTYYLVGDLIGYSQMVSSLGIHDFDLTRLPHLLKLLLVLD